MTRLSPICFSNTDCIIRALLIVAASTRSFEYLKSITAVREAIALLDAVIASVRQQWLSTPRLRRRHPPMPRSYLRPLVRIDRGIDHHHRLTALQIACRQFRRQRHSRVSARMVPAPYLPASSNSMRYLQKAEYKRTDRN